MPLNLGADSERSPPLEVSTPTPLLKMKSEYRRGKNPSHLGVGDRGIPMLGLLFLLPHDRACPGGRGRGRPVADQGGGVGAGGAFAGPAMPPSAARSQGAGLPRLMSPPCSQPRGGSLKADPPPRWLGRGAAVRRAAAGRAKPGAPRPPPSLPPLPREPGPSA